MRPSARHGTPPTEATRATKEVILLAVVPGADHFFWSTADLVLGCTARLMRSTRRPPVFDTTDFGERVWFWPRLVAEDDRRGLHSRPAPPRPQRHRKPHHHHLMQPHCAPRHSGHAVAQRNPLQRRQIRTDPLRSWQVTSASRQAGQTPADEPCEDRPHATERPSLLDQGVCDKGRQGTTSSRATAVLGDPSVLRLRQGVPDPAAHPTRATSPPDTRE
jgi:hypothetical protein